MNTALLLAGGAGSRIHTDIPKQYARVCGRMLITYALEPLLESPRIDMVEIVAECRWREAILEDARRAGPAVGKISGFAVPGMDRQSSILNGLRDILSRRDERAGGAAADNADTVLIHDAARPLLTGKLIEDCYQALAGHEGVMPVLPMKDTVYLSGDGMRVERLLERSHVYAGQAPELFLLDEYYQANAALLPEDIENISGSAQPAVMAGMDIVMIPGDEGNFKVTTETDMRRFREYMEDMHNQQPETDR